MEQRVLSDRAGRLMARLERCELCPRMCRVDRTRGEMGVCRTGAAARVASFGPHFGEEPQLTGWSGSGTVFFSRCNLNCVFCQNFDISRSDAGDEASAASLARIFLALQRRGCHNLNLVTPTHVVPQIVSALALAVDQGFSLPVIYNCGGYERPETLRELEGVVDIYMPDVKFLSPSSASRYCAAPDYPDAVRASLKEMARQVGPLVLDGRGMARRGLLVRHLVMPGDASTTRAVLEFLADEIGKKTCLNLMDQYRPCGAAYDFPEIARRTSGKEWSDALACARSLGISPLEAESIP